MDPEIRKQEPLFTRDSGVRDYYLDGRCRPHRTTCDVAPTAPRAQWESYKAYLDASAGTKKDTCTSGTRPISQSRPDPIRGRTGAPPVDIQNEQQRETGQNTNDQEESQQTCQDPTANDSGPILRCDLNPEPVLFDFSTHISSPRDPRPSPRTPSSQWRQSSRLPVRSNLTPTS